MDTGAGVGGVISSGAYVGRTSGGLVRRLAEAANYELQASGTWYVVRGTWYVVRGTWYVVRGTWYVVRGTW